MTRTSLETTAAYYAANPTTRLFRWGLGASQRLWPTLAVRAASRLFATPLPPKWLNRRRTWGPDWRIEAWPFENASLTMYSRPIAPHGPVVLLVHGWGGHAGQMLALADSLQAKGLRPVILELPAHGRSAGSISTLPQFARAIEYAAARLTQQGHGLYGLVAHSLAANATAYAVSRGLPVSKLVLMAPPASPYEYTRLFAHVFGLSEKTRAAMQRRVEAREGILMPLFEPAAVGPRIQQPTLVVHDRRDSINRFADGEAYRDAIGNAQLIATDDLGHRRILKDETVVAQVAGFISDTTGQIPVIQP
ncbi:MAG TPA: alpha/beta fold hydrolase [Polaromonas sp.]|uniref:alpha/beta fold hydrolase n=1 Tax=Polaromonas sp. TaxID=1869339 RepID=UPI002D76041B|nr:alpha/beta fold hydrolase [Polaromonas sp.]HYW55574.1 alpha/beta fold hydrolase [Polaromonas sp.]